MRSLVGNNDVVGPQEVYDVLHELYSGLLTRHIIALSVTESKQVCESDRDRRFP